MGLRVKNDEPHICACVCVCACARVYIIICTYYVQTFLSVEMDANGSQSYHTLDETF